MKTVFCRCRTCRAHRRRALNQAQIKRAQRHVRQARRNAQHTQRLSRTGRREEATG